jgi:hypothetical protein
MQLQAIFPSSILLFTSLEGLVSASAVPIEFSLDLSELTTRSNWGPTPGSCGENLCDRISSSTNLLGICTKAFKGCYVPAPVTMSWVFVTKMSAKESTVPVFSPAQVIAQLDIITGATVVALAGRKMGRAIRMGAKV